MKVSGFLNSLRLLLLLANFPFCFSNWLVDDYGCRTPSGGVGNCISIRTCRPMIDFLNAIDPIDERTRKYLKGFQCGFDGTGPKVCCPSSRIKFGQTKENNFCKLIAQPLRKSEDNYDCKTKTQDLGRCVPLESCGHVSGIISRMQKDYDSQRADGRAFFLKTNSPNTQKIWCEYVGENGGNVGRDKCVQAEGFSYLWNISRELDLKAVLSSYECEEGKVCCPFTSADPAFHPNLKLLESKCAVETTVPHRIRRRLVSNGENATLLEYPWMATLKYSGGKRNTRLPMCCKSNKPAVFADGRPLHKAPEIKAVSPRVSFEYRIGARLGEFDLNKKIDCQGSFCAPEVQDFEVTAEDAIVHPDYETVTYHNDIALIRLRKNVEFSYAVKPICLPIKFLARANPFDKHVIVTGWGMTEKGTPSSTLLEINIPVVPPGNCSKYYPKSVDIIDKQFCAGGAGQDSCKGDSGGPLIDVKFLNFERAVVQYGIVSFGLHQKCGEGVSPSVYTRVTSYLNWILDNLKPY